MLFIAASHTSCATSRQERFKQLSEYACKAAAKELKTCKQRRVELCVLSRSPCSGLLICLLRHQASGYIAPCVSAVKDASQCVRKRLLVSIHLVLLFIYFKPDIFLRACAHADEPMPCESVRSNGFTHVRVGPSSFCILQEALEHNSTHEVRHMWREEVVQPRLSA